MYTRKEFFARSAGGRLLADRDQSIVPAIKRMTRIHDFNIFGGGYVIVTLMGISRGLRSKASIGARPSASGGLLLQAETTQKPA